MEFQLSFSHRYVYHSFEAGITVEASLQYGEKRESTLAKVDPGSQACLFERGLGEALGVNIESGYRRRFFTLTGGLIAYGHWLSWKHWDFVSHQLSISPNHTQYNAIYLGRKAGCCSSNLAWLITTASFI